MYVCVCVCIYIHTYEYIYIYIYIYINFRNSSVTYCFVINWHNIKIHFEANESKVWMLLLFMVLISLVSVLNLLYFYISTFRSMCAVPNMAVFCSSLTSWFPGMLLTYFLNVFEIVPVAPIITGITFDFTFHMRGISIVRSIYFRILSASFLITFLSPAFATSINIHVPFSLSRIIMSGMLLGIVLSVCTCWFHNMVTLPPWLVYYYYYYYYYYCERRFVRFIREFYSWMYGWCFVTSLKTFVI